MSQEIQESEDLLVLTPLSDELSQPAVPSTTSLPSPQAQPKEKKFRLHAKNLFLTFPQCATKKEDSMSVVKEFFKENLASAVISEELHADGTPHLHMLIRLHKKVNLVSSTALDVLVDPQVHGNYQAARSIIRTMKYVTKDKNYLSHNVDVKTFLSSARQKKQAVSVSNAVVESIQAGSTLTDLMESHPTYLLNHARNVKEFIHLHRTSMMQRRRKELLITSVSVRPVGTQNTSWNRAISAWIRMNIRMTRTFKQKQLYVHGPPDMGKSSFVMQLEREHELSVYWMPALECFYDEYEDGAYDLVVLDEFRAQKRIQELNLWLQGGVMPVRKKGGQGLKRDNIPMIILSNYAPEDCYGKCSPSQLAPLLARLNVVEVKGPIRLEKVEEFIPTSFSDIDPADEVSTPPGFFGGKNN